MHKLSWQKIKPIPLKIFPLSEKTNWPQFSMVFNLMDDKMTPQNVQNLVVKPLANLLQFCKKQDTHLLPQSIYYSSSNRHSILKVNR